MTSAGRESLLAALSTVLWRERQLLELLLFKLVEEQLVLTCGQERWLARATREVEIVAEQVRVAELGREIEVAALTTELGLGGTVSLRELIAAVDDPWPEILAKHREAFLDLTSEIASAADHNRELVARAQAATRQTLQWLAGQSDHADAYTSTGTPTATAKGQHLLNWAM